MSDIDIDNCRLRRYPAELLSKPAHPIERIDDSTRQLVEKMADIMVRHCGIGLAGPQAGVSLRIFIIALDGTRESLKTYINPTVTPTSSELSPSEEGCLSVPGVNTKISRYTTCSVTATDLQGNEFSESAEGLYARCLQHEYDHIQGIIIADKMGSVARIAHRKQLKKLREDHERLTE